MDDTVLLATSRAAMTAKIRIINEFFKSHGMEINIKKTRFLEINGNIEHKQSITVDGLIVEACNQYLYLGSPFIADRSTTTIIRVHASNKMCHTLKFISFINKNNDIPFVIKRAALTSTLMYSCESWLNGDIRPVTKQYMWCIKQILGVRKSTPNDLCLTGLGCPPLQALVN